MSFQDLGRRLRTGDKEQMQEPQTMLSKMMIHLAKPHSPPLTITKQRYSPAAASVNTRSSQSASATSKVRPPTTPTMRTRPRPPAPAITTRCPVTSRPLLDNLSSFGDGQIPNQSSSCDMSEAPTVYDEDPMLPIVNPRENRTPSIFSQLTTEIANYQRMVSELESLLVPSSSNPEAQWRSRILIRSAKDADRDIWRRLCEYEANFGVGSNSSRAQIASRKLHRDFRRVHKHLIQFMGAYQLRQQVDISFLSTSANAGEDKEEFFDRAMRERHAEVNQIHSSMHKVNEIYTDLAALVEGQQEQIDKVAEHINYSRGATHAGADRLHKATMGMCAPLNGFDNDVHESPGEEPTCSKNNAVDRDFSWTMPFETIQDDLRSVHVGVMQLGKELVEDFQQKAQQSIMQRSDGMGCSCVSMGNYDSQVEQTGKFATMDEMKLA